MEKLHDFQKQLEENKIFKLILTIIVIFTVLPFYDYFNSQSNGILNIIFLILFSIEALIRTITFVRYLIKNISDGIINKNWKLVLNEFIFLLIDILATLTFTPVFPSGLRLLRLLRLIKLSRYITSTFSDMGRIISQPGIKKQILLTLGVIVTLTFLGAIILNLVGINPQPENMNDSTIEIEDVNNNNDDDDNDDNEMTFTQIIWHSLMYLLMPDPLGEIDIDSDPIGVIFVSLLMVLLGLVILSFIVGIGTEVVAELIEASRNKPLKFQNHIVIFGWNRIGNLFVKELLNMMKENLIEKEIVIIQNVDPTLPDRLITTNKLLTVRYYVDNPIEYLQNVNVKDAMSVVILSNLTEKADDSQVIQNILEVRSTDENKEKSFILIPTLEDPVNQMPAIRAGADEIVLPDVFMGSYIVQNILTPNLLKVYEELLIPIGNEIYVSKFDDLPGIKSGSGKYISIYDLQKHLINNGCGFLGIIEKTGENDHDYEAIANPLEWYDRKNSNIVSYEQLLKDKIIGVIALADNGTVLDNAMKRYVPKSDIDKEKIEYTKFVEDTSHELIAQKEGQKTIDILIFGWNYSVPTIIQQFISLILEPVNITVLINDSYNYSNRKIKFVNNKIRELLERYYPEDSLNKVLERNKVSVKRGSYLSETDLFSPDSANLSNQDIVVMLPDEYIKNNPDADNFLVVLKILNYYLVDKSLFKDNFMINALVVSLDSAKKLEDQIKKRNASNIFKVIASERIMSAFLAQTSLTRYIPKIYNSILTNTDLNIFRVIELNRILKKDEEIKSLITNGIINYKELYLKLIKHKVILIGYEQTNKDGKIEMIVNPLSDKWEINSSNDINFIVLICQENKYMKEF